MRSLKLSKSFILSIALNLVLAIALITASRHASPTQPDFIITNFLGAVEKPGSRTPTNAVARPVPQTNPHPAVVQHADSEPVSNAVAKVIDANTKARLRGKTFTWQDVETEDYPVYMANLREAGCPETAVRHIILTDVNELFANKRMKEAILNDQQWWQPDYNYVAVQNFQARTLALQEERRALLKKFFGPDFDDPQGEQYMVYGRTPLTGPVLGKLAPQVHNAVQEICEHAQDRHQAYQETVFSGAKPYSAVELAKLREQTRSELTQVLNGDEIEEFLLRFSHNAYTLRYELRVFEPTAEEFRKIFRATDSINHKVQLEYGDELPLSTNQRDELEQRRLAAVKNVLPPDRYQAYLTKRQIGFRPPTF